MQIVYKLGQICLNPLRVSLLMEETKFLKDIEYACQEIRNRYFSIEVAQGKFSEVPWWIKKIELIEDNCKAFLDRRRTEINWERDFGKLENSWDSKEVKTD